MLANARTIVLTLLAIAVAVPILDYHMVGHSTLCCSQSGTRRNGLSEDANMREFGLALNEGARSSPNQRSDVAAADVVPEESERSSGCTACEIGQANSAVQLAFEIFHLSPSSLGEHALTPTFSFEGIAVPTPTPPPRGWSEPDVNSGETDLFVFDAIKRSASMSLMLRIGS